MAYIRKTEDEYQIHVDYGQGFEEVTCESSWKKARETKKAYVENEGYPVKIIKRRVKKDEE
jgi:hypothetical protein